MPRIFSSIASASPFAVYGEASGTERLIPFDIVPHVIPGRQWDSSRADCSQRVTRAEPLPARHLPRAGDPPRRQDPRRAGASRTPSSASEMVGVDVPGGVYAHIAGVDLVRHSDGEYYVLEDNLRTPSGVSYMLENRKMMMRLFPELFAQPADPAGRPLSRTCCSRRCARVAPRSAEQPDASSCSRPGHYNSAYFEHAFLAQQMGIELVEGADLFVANDTVFMRTTQGPQKVDVIYRRIDDDFLDPLAFRPDSMLGVPGLLAAYRARRVTLANAIGTGRRRRQVDVSVRARDDPLLPRRGADPQQRPDVRCCASPRTATYVLAHLDELVVKEAQGSGGYGMLVGPDCEPRRARALPPAHPRRPGALHRAAHAVAVRGVRPSCGESWPTGTSTCGPYVLTGLARSTSCPAASRAWRCAKARSW